MVPTPRRPLLLERTPMDTLQRLYSVARLTRSAVVGTRYPQQNTLAEVKRLFDTTAALKKHSG